MEEEAELWAVDKGLQRTYNELLLILGFPVLFHSYLRPSSKQVKGRY